MWRATRRGFFSRNPQVLSQLLGLELLVDSPCLPSPLAPVSKAKQEKTLATPVSLRSSVSLLMPRFQLHEGRSSIRLLAKGRDQLSFSLNGSIQFDLEASPQFRRGFLPSSQTHASFECLSSSPRCKPVQVEAEAVSRGSSQRGKQPEEELEALQNSPHFASTNDFDEVSCSQ